MFNYNTGQVEICTYLEEGSERINDKFSCKRQFKTYSMTEFEIQFSIFLLVMMD